LLHESIDERGPGPGRLGVHLLDRDPIGAEEREPRVHEIAQERRPSPDTVDLRHTCASLLLAQGCPLVVMETLGHSAIAGTMNTYGHVMPLAQREAADRINELFELFE
jgi:hypothetical protein